MLNLLCFSLLPYFFGLFLHYVLFVVFDDDNDDDGDDDDQKLPSVSPAPSDTEDRSFSSFLSPTPPTTPTQPTTLMFLRHMRSFIYIASSHPFHTRPSTRNSSPSPSFLYLLLFNFLSSQQIQLQAQAQAFAILQRITSHTHRLHISILKPSTSLLAHHYLRSLTFLCALYRHLWFHYPGCFGLNLCLLSFSRLSVLLSNMHIVLSSCKPALFHPLLFISSFSYLS